MPSKRKPVVPTPEIISIADLSEVAALLAAGVEMVGQSFNGSWVVFEFADSCGVATQTLLEHRNRRLLLPSLDVTDAMKRAKDMAFATRRNSGEY
ncbi:MAG: hypothetical protein KJ050_16055 [Candidatus Omnitrophica bacterium]|nr:hypothetical protein [bacterium]MBV6481571.1 hypothetical protein [bacterium]MCL4736439.1 hypothetical protein [Candidatus Omnitrophota bacterium]